MCQMERLWDTSFIFAFNFSVIFPCEIMFISEDCTESKITFSDFPNQNHDGYFIYLDQFTYGNVLMVRDPGNRKILVSDSRVIGCAPWSWQSTNEHSVAFVQLYLRVGQ